MNTGVIAQETVDISLDVGKRMLVVGANESGIAPFRRPGEDRYQFMDVGSAKQLKDLPGNNFAYIIVNGRIPPQVQSWIETLTDRAKCNAVMLVTANGGALQRMMENFPMGNKGVVSLAVPDVVRTIEFNNSSTTTSKSSPPPSPSPPPPPPAATLQGLLDQLENIYDEYGGQHKKVIAHFRNLGFGEEKISDGALYQRCLTIRKRRAKNGGPTASVDISAGLLASENGQQLLTAIAEARQVTDLVLQLAGEVSAENQALRGIVQQQNEKLKGLPALQAEVVQLREKADKVRQMFAETES
jgi:hypothetical protein